MVLPRYFGLAPTALQPHHYMPARVAHIAEPIAELLHFISGIVCYADNGVRRYADFESIDYCFKLLIEIAGTFIIIDKKISYIVDLYVYWLILGRSFWRQGAL